MSWYYCRINNQQVSEHSQDQPIPPQNDQRFRELADFMPQVLFEMNLEGNYTYVNHFALESLGFTQEDIDNGLNFLELFAPDDHSRVIEDVQ